MERIVAALVALYTADGLRGDGYPVRFARLEMWHPCTITALCWCMEVAFVVAWYSRRKRAAIAAFWMAYLAILVQV